MVSKENFNKVWKDSSRENILNQFYHEHNELFRIKKEVREKLEYYKTLQYGTYDSDNIIAGFEEILDKGE